MTARRSNHVAFSTIRRTVTIRRTAAFVAVFGIVAATAYTRRAPTSPRFAAPAVAAIDTVELAVDAPAEVELAHAVHVTVRNVPIAVNTLQLDVVDVWGARRLPIAAHGATAEIDIPASWMTRAGDVQLLVNGPGAHGSAALRVQPGAVTDGILPLVGPRTMIADGVHRTMITAIPRDAQGNAMPNNTPVFVHVRRPNGDTQELSGTVQDLVAGIILQSGHLAGRTTMRVEVAGATGPEAEVMELAGPPVAFALLGPDEPALADGRSLMRIHTSVLRDQYDNVVTDGTSVELRWLVDGVVSRATSVTISGVATFHVEAPRRAGTFRFTALAGSVVTDPLLVVIAPDTDGYAVEVRAQPDGQPDEFAVIVGPVMTALGGFASDGTTVTVHTPDGEDHVGALVGGKASVRVTARSGDVITVNVLGHLVTAVVS